MAGFLPDQWFDELDAAARGTHVAGDLRLVIQQVVPDGPDGAAIVYSVSVADGAITVRRGRADAPDVTFTQDRATAEAIHRGELSAQTAFIEGRLRLDGDLRAVIEQAGSIADIDDVLAALRA